MSQPEANVARPTTPRSQSREMQAYLLKFMPLLTDTLTAMSLSRPRDPYAFLAAQLLEHSDFPSSPSVRAALLAHAGGQAEATAPRGSAVQVAPAPSAPAPICLIFAGAPCSGKGSQAEYIKQEYGLYHLSTGDLLRAEVAAGSALGREAKSFMDSGQLVPDALIIDIVKAKVTDPEVARRGWLLDGFPRTAAQAKALQDANIHADLFLQLNVPDAALIRRVTGRRVDAETGRTYHVEYDPPPADIAPRCIQRSDDTEAKIQTRLQAYHTAIHAIADLYKHVRIEIDGDRPKGAITADIRRVIDKLRASKQSV